MNCFCPYCRKALEISEGPGDYVCSYCNGWFAIYRVDVNCPNCSMLIQIEDGPGSYTCPGCKRDFKLNKDGGVTVGFLRGLMGPCCRSCGWQSITEMYRCGNCGYLCENCYGTEWGAFRIPLIC